MKRHFMRCVYLPAIRRNVSLSAYIKAVKLAKANPAQTFTHGLDCDYPCTGADVVRQWWGVVTKRINNRFPIVCGQDIQRRAPLTRKQTAEYQLHLYRDSQRLKDIGRRIRVYQFETKEMRARFGHLLAERDGAA